MLDIWENVSVQHSGKARTGYSKEKPLEWEGEAIPRFPEGQDTFSTMNLARSASCCATCFISTASVNSLPKVRWVWGAQTKAGHSRDRSQQLWHTGMGMETGIPERNWGRQGSHTHPHPGVLSPLPPPGWDTESSRNKVSRLPPGRNKVTVLHRLPAPPRAPSRKTPGKKGEVYKPDFNI